MGREARKIAEFGILALLERCRISEQGLLIRRRRTVRLRPTSPVLCRSPLLACLIARPGQIVSTDSLIFELWGDSPPNMANNMVSIYVHRLRKEVIGDADGKVLVHRAPGYLLRLSPNDLDLQVFESLVAEGRAALAAAEPERAAGLLGEALGLWRGPLLADVPPSPLIETQADQMAELRIETTELRVEADLACGRAARVVAELRGLVTEYPLRERLWALLMRALEGAGRRAEALETYAQARQVIADELGVDPGSELQRLYAELLAADAPAVSTRHQPAQEVAAPDATGAAVRVRPDPGEARAAAPGRAVMPGVGDDMGDGTGSAGSHAEPPGTIAIGTFAEAALAWVPATAEPRAAGADRGLSAGIPRPTQLPADIGDFTGRETHVEHLCALLVGEEGTGSSGAVRLAVVNGAGGLGQDHARRSRRAPGSRGVPGWPALRRPAWGEHTACPGLVPLP